MPGQCPHERWTRRVAPTDGGPHLRRVQRAGSRAVGDRQRVRAAAGKTDGSGRVDSEIGQDVRGVVRPVVERNSCVFGVPDARPVRIDEVDARVREPARRAAVRRRVIRWVPCKKDRIAVGVAVGGEASRRPSGCESDSVSESFGSQSVAGIGGADPVGRYSL